MTRSAAQGFTLIELLVVIAIIALLSTVVLSSLKDAREKAAVVKIKETAEQIKIAMELYRNTNGQYPIFNSFQFDTNAGTAYEGPLAGYMKDMSFSNDGLSSFQFRTQVPSIYYHGATASTTSFASCENIPAGQFVPYTIYMTITPADYDLEGTYGFYRWVNSAGAVSQNTYCLFTPPY